MHGECVPGQLLPLLRLIGIPMGEGVGLDGWVVAGRE